MSKRRYHTLFKVIAISLLVGIFIGYAGNNRDVLGFLDNYLKPQVTREVNPVVFKDFKCISTNKIRFLKDNEVFVLLSSPVIIDKYLQENSYKILTSDGIIGYIWDNSEDSLIFTEMNK
jgi:hypothetical protein